MAMKALGKYGGNSLIVSVPPPASPRVASGRMFSSRMLIEGGRFGISSDWIGGRCAPTHTTAPTPAMPSHSISTTDQYATRAISEPLRLRLLFLLLPDLRGLRGFATGRSAGATWVNGPASK